MRIILSRQALRDLHHVKDFIAADNSAAAKAVVKTIVLYTKQQLTAFPTSGRPGRVRGTFELVIPKLPYIVPYRIKGNEIQILRVYHQSRRWPDHL